MNRAEFMEELERLLEDLPEAEREEAILYYQDYFEDAGAENEARILQELETPEKVAGIIKEGLKETETVGEFTETGYRERRFEDVQQLSTGTEPLSEKGSRIKASQEGESFSWQQGNQPGQETAHGEEEQSCFSKKDNFHRQEQRDPDWEYQGYADTSQESGQWEQEFRKQEKPKRTLLEKILWIALLCLIVIPAGIPLAGGAIGVFVGVAMSFFGVLFAVAATAILGTLAGLVVFLYGLVQIFYTPLPGMLIAGAGLLALSIGLLFVILSLWLFGKLLPALERFTIQLFRKLFGRIRRSQA